MRELAASARIAISAGRRRLNGDGFAGFEHGGVATLKLLQLSVLTPNPVLADLTALAAGKPERTHAAVAGEDRAVHAFEKTDRAANAVAGVPAAPAARALADVEILEQHRIAEFEHFRVGEPGIGHVGVHGVGAGKAGPGRGAGADRLVILVLRVAE